MSYQPPLLSCLIFALVLRSAWAAPALVLPDTHKSGLYFPTQVGAKWVYQEGQIEDRRVVTAVEKKSGEVNVSVGQVSDDGKVLPLEVVRVSQRGLFEYPGVPSEIDQPVVLLRLPYKVGDEWKYIAPRIGLFPREEGTMRVEGSEEIEVPTGKFTAVRVVARATAISGTILMVPSRTTFWYAPGVGLVKRIDYKKRTLLLKSFMPGKN